MVPQDICVRNLRDDRILQMIAMNDEISFIGNSQVFTFLNVKFRQPSMSPFSKFVKILL